MEGQQWKDFEQDEATMVEKFPAGAYADETNEKGERGQWTSKLDFFFSLLSAAVGLGNVWRFPYLCFKNGGGAFLVPYFLAAVTCGIPLFLLEISMGQYMGVGAIPAMGYICPLLKGCAYASVTIVTLLCIYQCVIISWAIFYLASSFTTLPGLPWQDCDMSWNTDNCHDATTMADTAAGNCTSMAPLNQECSGVIRSSVEEFWELRALQITEGLTQLGGLRWELAGCLLLAWILVYIFIWKGLHRSGKLIWFTALFPYVMLTVLLLRAVTLQGAADGLLHYVTPQWEKLQLVQTWIEAFTQVFFSYSLATATLMVLGSYNSFHHNCYRDAVLVSVVNSGTSMFAGVVTFSVLGHMAHLKNMTSIDDVVTSGPGLAFLTYPEIITKLPVSPLWSILFFSMMITIGVDSAFCDMEAVLTSIVDNWSSFLRPHRKKFVLGMSVGMFALGLSMVTKGGMYIFQLMDIYAASGIPVLWVSFLETVAICWFFGVERVRTCCQQMLGFKPNMYWLVCWQYICPFLLGGLFVFYICTYEAPRYGKHYVYPVWEEVLGISLSLVSMVWIPAYSIYYLYTTPGSLRHVLRKGITSEVTSRQDEKRRGVEKAHSQSLTVPTVSIIPLQ